MTHLRIELNTITENVTSDVIHKLYETAKAIIDAEEANEVEESLVSLKGNLLVPVSYRAEVTWLLTKFPDLHITSADYAIPFEDPNMLSYLLSLGIGSNGMITEAQAAAATVVANSTNTTITKFNELKYFTNITESKGGFNGFSAGKIKFYGWTALEEVDISNLTSIGHNGGFAWEDTFTDCSSLKKVTASNNLTKLGYNAFFNCQKLDTFTGLEGTVEVWDFAFYNCKKLPQSFFQPLSFLIKGVSSEPSNFTSCDLLESITVAEGTTTIPAKCFRDCPKLSTVTLPSTIIKIDNLAFYGCDKLSTINIPSGNITIGYGAFQNCTALTSADLSSCTSIGDNAFNGCTSLTNVDLSNVTSIGASAFQGCTSLTSIDLSGCTSLPNYPGSVFKNCTSLTTVIGLENLTFPGSASFYGCTNLGRNQDLVLNITSGNAIANTFRSTAYKTVTLHAPNMTSFYPTGSDQYYMFYGMNELQKMDLSDTKLTEIGTLGGNSDARQIIVVPDTVTSFNYEAFFNIKCLYYIILATTPPSINNDSYYSFASNSYIYVPDAALTDYQTAWSGNKCGPRLKAISELPSTVTWATQQSLSNS